MLAIIGGSGVYNIDGLENTRWVKAASSFGEPSDEVLIGELAGQSVRLSCRATAAGIASRRRESTSAPTSMRSSAWA